MELHIYKPPQKSPKISRDKKFSVHRQTDFPSPFQKKK